MDDKNGAIPIVLLANILAGLAQLKLKLSSDRSNSISFHMIADEQTQSWIYDWCSIELGSILFSGSMHDRKYQSQCNK